MVKNSDFQPIRPEDRIEPYIPPQKLRERGWRQMKKNRLALWGMAIVCVMTVLAVFLEFYAAVLELLICIEVHFVFVAVVSDLIIHTIGEFGGYQCLSVLEGLAVPNNIGISHVDRYAVRLVEVLVYIISHDFTSFECVVHNSFPFFVFVF